VAALLFIAPSLTHAWLRILIPARNAVTTTTVLLAGSLIAW